MHKPVTFFSEGVRLAGDLYLPDDLASGEKRAGIVLCHGYTGVRNIYLPDNARVLTWPAMSFSISTTRAGATARGRKPASHPTAGSPMCKQR